MANFRRVTCMSLLSISLLSAPSLYAQAATASATLAVSATVLSFCTIAALPLAFGNYTNAVLAASTTVTTTCTAGTTFNIGLDSGLGTGASIAARKMTFNTNTLTYGLYSDSAHTVVFGNTVGTNTVSGTATGTPQATSVYGQIPASQFAAPGLYADTVTATITY